MNDARHLVRRLHVHDVTRNTQCVLCNFVMRLLISFLSLFFSCLFSFFFFFSRIAILLPRSFVVLSSPLRLSLCAGLRPLDTRLSCSKNSAVRSYTCVLRTRARATSRIIEYATLPDDIIRPVAAYAELTSKFSVISTYPVIVLIFSTVCKLESRCK